MLISQKVKLVNPRTSVYSVSNQLKTIDERLRAIADNAWTYQEDYLFQETDNDVSVNFKNSINIKGTSTLADYLQFYQGMKPYEKGKGNPRQTRQMMNDRIYHADKQIDKAYIPLLTASSVKRYQIKWEHEWIKYGDNLAASRKFSIFSQDQILLNRIVSREKLDAVYVSDVFINNSDIFNLIPKKINLPISVKVFAAIIASKLCAVYFKSRNVNLDRSAFPKINVNTLESFPTPEIDTAQQTELETLANHMLALTEQVQTQAKQVAGLLQTDLNVPRLTDKLLNWPALDWPGLLAELAKQKVGISLPKQMEWKPFFEAQRGQIQTIQTQRATTDTQIDRLVYVLYGLTEADVALVEA